MSEALKTMDSLRAILSHVNESAPACVFSDPDMNWIREEEPSGRAKLDYVPVPERFLGDILSKAGLDGEVTVEMLRFGVGDYIDLHKHVEVSSALLVPGCTACVCDMFEFEIFWLEEQSAGPTKLIRTEPYCIAPNIWHRIQRIGRGDYGYILSASTPKKDSDIRWYADE